MIKFGSVCSGIEAASVAWHPLGWQAAWLSEIEPFPCAVLKHHYPDVPNHGDMTTLPERILSGEVEAPDVFCGGTPCQAFSVAGLRNSLDDARGNLSLTFVGIANAIDHVRSVRSDAPGIIFWENVPGVLSTKDNAFGCFLGALAGENDPLIPSGGKWTNAGCVFGPQRTVAWRVLDAQYFGVAQRRRRVFVVASARADFNPAKVLFEFNGMRRDSAPSREAREETPSPTGMRLDVSLIGTLTAGFGKVGAPEVDAYTCLPSMAEPIPLNTMNLLGREVEDGRRGFGIGESGDPCPTLTKAHTHAVAQPIGIFQDSEFGVAKYDSAGTLRAGRIPEHQMVMQAIAFSRNDDGGDATNDLSPTMRVAGRAGGMLGVAQPIAFNIAPGKGNLKNDIHITNAHISKTIDASGSNPSMHQGGAAIVQTMAVRRLTPVECERLQGFPDNYTNIPWRKKDESPDGPRYKALGNSWAVPVIHWIGQRIQENIRVST
jgi:DNA (cytosine-5)-methyltransferase 1